MLEPYEKNRMTGWFGVPGDMSGKMSTKIHIVNKDSYTTICGTKLSDRHTFQFNASGVYLPYVECKHCLRKINKMEKR